MKDFLIHLIRLAGEVSLESFGTIKDIQYKAERNIVTSIDIKIENMLIERIHERYPDHNIVGEENGSIQRSGEFTWYIDPIDGTANYFKGMPFYNISIAVNKENVTIFAAVFDPLRKEMYFAQEGKGAYLNDRCIKVNENPDLDKALILAGISSDSKMMDQTIKLQSHLAHKVFRVRELGSCALEMCYVAAGRVDALIKLKSHPWDFMAGKLMIRESQGIVTNLKGKELKTETTSFVASNKKLHDKILKELGDEYE